MITNETALKVAAAIESVAMARTTLANLGREIREAGRDIKEGLVRVALAINAYEDRRNDP